MPSKIVPDLVRNQTVVTLQPGATVREAAQIMTERHIGAVLVEENGRLAGIFTERDVLARVVAKGLDPDGTRLDGVMTRDPDTLDPGDTPLHALTRMRDAGYRHLPVVNGETLVGIVSIRDLYAAVHSQLESDLQQRDAFIFDTGYGTG